MRMLIQRVLVWLYWEQLQRQLIQYVGYMILHLADVFSLVLFMQKWQYWILCDTGDLISLFIILWYLTVLFVYKKVGLFFFGDQNYFFLQKLFGNNQF